MLAIIQKLTNVKKNCLALAVFAALVALFYGNTLQNGFVHDDIPVVAENPYVHDLRYLPKVVTGCPWEQSFGGCQGISYYRPIQTLSYLLTWQISSAPWFFHLINLFYFLAAVFLVFILVKTLTKNFITAFLAALIFLINPVNSEVVNWISAVPELAYTVFTLLSTIFFIRYRKNPTIKKLFFIPLFYFLGAISKEPALLLPIIFVFLDLFFFKIPFKKLFEFKKIKPYFAILVPFALYFAMRRFALGRFGGVENLYYGIFSLPERIYAFFTLFADYLLKLIKPYPLSLFYTFDKKSEFLDSHFIISFAVVLIFFSALSLFLIKRKGLLVFALLWIFLFLSPVFIFINGLGENIFAERYVFASNVGFSLILAILFIWLRERCRFLRVILAIILIAAAGTSFYIIYQRNLIWNNNDILYEATLKENPRAYAIRFAYAADLGLKKGDFVSSEKEFKIITEQNPGWANISSVYNNLGDIYRMRGDMDGALEYYKKSIKTGAWNYNVANNAGAIYAEKKEYLSALVYFCLAIGMDPEAQKPQENFERLSSLIEEKYKDNPTLLWEDLTGGSSYTQSGQEKIKYIQKNCQKENCAFLFLSQLDGGEIMLPSLILGKSSKNEIIRPKPSFNPQSGGIMLETAPEYQNQPLTFIFPTCQGLYYQANTE